MSLAIDVDRYMSNKPASFWRTRKSSVGEAVAAAPAEIVQPQDQRLSQLDPAMTQRAPRKKSGIFSTQAGMYAAIAAGTAVGLAVGLPTWIGAAGLFYGMYRTVADGQQTADYLKSRHDGKLIMQHNKEAGISQTPSVPQRILNFLRMPIKDQFGSIGNRLAETPSRTQVMKMAGYGAAVTAAGPAAIVLALSWEAANLAARGAEYVVYSTMVRNPKHALRNLRARQMRRSMK
ncbi:MAG: hypothetical protein Alpg2KO_09730 [Alphaproteobacteria bacterium]